MYYSLPSDTPAAMKIEYTATSEKAAEIDLLSGRQRPSSNRPGLLPTTRHSGRPGSYFAHALVGPRELNGRGWTTLECLKLWGAPQWIHGDPAGVLPQLPAYESLADWKANARVDRTSDRLLQVRWLMTTY